MGWYGIETVRNWYSVDSSLKVGGPSAAHSAYLKEMLELGSENNCMPDYLTGHIYNNDSNSVDPLSPFKGPQIDRENKSPNYITGIARGVRKLLQEASYKGE